MNNLYNENALIYLNGGWSYCSVILDSQMLTILIQNVDNQQKILKSKVKKIKLPSIKELEELSKEHSCDIFSFYDIEKEIDICLNVKNKLHSSHLLEKLTELKKPSTLSIDQFESKENNPNSINTKRSDIKAKKIDTSLSHSDHNKSLDNSKNNGYSTPTKCSKKFPKKQTSSNFNSLNNNLNNIHVSKKTLNQTKSIQSKKLLPSGTIKKDVTPQISNKEIYTSEQIQAIISYLSLSNKQSNQNMQLQMNLNELMKQKPYSSSNATSNLNEIIPPISNFNSTIKKKEIFTDEDVRILNERPEDQTIIELVKGFDRESMNFNLKPNMNTMLKNTKEQKPESKLSYIKEETEISNTLDQSNREFIKNKDNKEIDPKRKSFYQMIINKNLNDNVHSKFLNISGIKSLKLSNETDSLGSCKSNLKNNLVNKGLQNRTKDEKIKILIERIDNSEELIFDSYILKKNLIENDLIKEDLGLIYKQLKSEFAKSNILCEMIAIMSKSFLTKSVDKSLAIISEQKDRKLIKASNQNSIEFCIIDIFNTFLGNNSISKEFFIKILPNYLASYFKIDFILDLRSIVHLPLLFCKMQYHNKIFFNESIEINFNHLTPFSTSDIKLISVINTIKWYRNLKKEIKADINETNLEIQLNKDNLLTSICNINQKLKEEKLKREDELDITNIKESSIYEDDGLILSNVKRINYKNFELEENVQSFLNKNKMFAEYDEELRINNFKFIYYLLKNRNYEMALNICDNYTEKYKDTLFLNPLLFLLLAEIYSELLSVEYSIFYFEKSISLLNWMYGENNSPLAIDVYYTFSNILQKFNESNQYTEKIVEYLNKGKDISEKVRFLN